jgi:hypothetical protein
LLHNDTALPGCAVKLNGPEGNSDGVGAMVWLEDKSGKRVSPSQQVSAGSGYWSQNSPELLFALGVEPVEAVVRWPGGSVTRKSVTAGARKVTISR